MPNTQSLRVAMIGSYVPRKCGIATFTHNLATAIEDRDGSVNASNGTHVQIVAMNDRNGEYTYESKVTIQIHQHRREEYRNAAELLNVGKIDVVCLQHEYGLFGGECGDYLLDLLDRLHQPLVTTPHSILSRPTDKQRDVLRALCDRSGAVVVMANRARQLLQEVYEVPIERVRLIPHGVPDIPFGNTEPFKERFGLAGRPVILTFGLLGPGKSIETVLDAIADVAQEFPDVAYVVLGETHPAIKRESGELYRISLELRAVELGIQKNVLFHNRYVSNEDLLEYLQAADLYATPYREKEQITSGTLAYALAAGKAIVSTPYWHAQELLVNGRGRLVDFGDVRGFASAFRELLGNPDRRKAMQKAAYGFGRSMVWPRVGEAYRETFAHVCRTFTDEARDRVSARRVLMRMSLPDCKLDHLYAMSDDTGILQHAQYSTPDRHHGYCVDDNARALIVGAMAWSLSQDEGVLPRLRTYLSFLHFAQIPETGRFRNFMSYDRRWLEEDGSDDCQGRALWALGYVVAHAPTDSIQQLAMDLFRRALPAVETLQWPRSWALSLLGLHYYLRRFPDDTQAADMKRTLTRRLDEAISAHESADWPWFEDDVTYDNARIPQAMIIAGVQLEEQACLERGLRVLDWLLDKQTASEGHLTVIGNKGWMKRDGERAKFDQQPLEAAALIGACKAAYRATQEGRWLIQMRRCFEWYIGRNDLGVSMVDFKSRGCYDGLTPTGANSNQGAESLLAWLLSLLIMYEMQSGDAPDFG